MRIRQLYRQEHALMPWDSIPNDLILPWISEQEAKWEQLEDEQFGNISIDGIELPPFEVEKINSILTPNGLLYGAGFGMHRKPTFFLGKLLHIATIDGCTAYYIDGELERDLFASPAMLQGNNIYIRLQPLYDFVYDKISTLQGRRHDSIIADTFGDIRLKNPNTDNFRKRFEALSLNVSQILLLHEAAEYAEDSSKWLELLGGITDRFVEIYLRAAKDLLADTSINGPLRHIIDTQDKTLLAFYTILLDNVRKEVFPEISTAYEKFASGSSDWQSIEQARTTGYSRAMQFRQEILTLWENQHSIGEINSYIKQFIKNIL
ncbi:hypothetical protein ASN18_0037 [Candidatus Magnetominusculus xianensis]|uniref:Uncharacterized protein n=2 Tax=Candidatus Magnetominusculus xianensis TaxID=1748249 RepID=A0ABR5SKU6_9BACT|nr:hypothetical protein ASN18_0037 [Candidatus Magnetominusculus xianensis]